MDNKRIKEKIDENNRIIESVITPNIFTLNNTVSILLKENAELQNKCIHYFENGFCIYCYKEEN